MVIIQETHEIPAINQLSPCRVAAFVGLHDLHFFHEKNSDGSLRFYWFGCCVIPCGIGCAMDVGLYCSSDKLCRLIEESRWL